MCYSSACITRLLQVISLISESIPTRLDDITNITITTERSRVASAQRHDLASRVSDEDYDSDQVSAPPAIPICREELSNMDS